MSPSHSEKQRKFMGAELGRLEAGKRTQTGMSESQLSDFARKPVIKSIDNFINKAHGSFRNPDKGRSPQERHAEEGKGNEENTSMRDLLGGPSPERRKQNEDYLKRHPQGKQLDAYGHNKKFEDWGEAKWHGQKSLDDLAKAIDQFIEKSDMSIEYQKKAREISNAYIKNLKRAPTQKELDAEMKKGGEKIEKIFPLAALLSGAAVGGTMAASTAADAAKKVTGGGGMPSPGGNADAGGAAGGAGEAAAAVPIVAMKKEKGKGVEPTPIRGSSMGHCPNRYNHTSAFPGYGREKCPECGKTYVNSSSIKKEIANPSNIQRIDIEKDYRQEDEKRLRHFNDLKDKAVDAEKRKILDSQRIKKSEDNLMNPESSIIVSNVGMTVL